ncbi:MAG: (d)CMP kinase [Lachnospiraceae bacterium]|jgi:cytidylate kinase|nr:(d)CMP kinase [Lachnospiraceae bacterium]
MGYQVAIDGPAGAGKSTIARLVARQKGFVYVDTGAMYRAVALHLLRSGITSEEVIMEAEESVTNKVAEKVAGFAAATEITIRYQEGEQIVLLNGEEVNTLIRTEEVGQMASVSSANPQVRAHLLNLQRQLAMESDVVMDGRDIGTCILPDADVKIFLTASVNVRAKRRHLELTQKGVACDLAEIEHDIEKRDHQDINREHSPLRRADDAVLVDTSDMSIEEAVAAVIAWIPKQR